MKKINVLNKLDRPYINYSSQLLIFSVLGLTIILFILIFFLNLYLVIIEDDNKYFEGALRNSLKKIINSEENALLDLSETLGFQVKEIFLENSNNDTESILRVIAETTDLIIKFENNNYLPKSVQKFNKNSTEPITVIDFLNSDIYYTIEEGKKHLKESDQIKVKSIKE